MSEEGQDEQDQQFASEYEGGMANSALEAAAGGREPVLAQLDEWSRTGILRGLYKWETVEMPDGTKSLQPTQCLYPDIEQAAHYGLSHLNMVVKYTWAESRAALMGFEGRFYGPLMKKYQRNEVARSALIAIHETYRRNVVGGSGEGSQQNFISSLVGSIREVTVGRRQVQKV